jgi:5,10-methenyltetrahydrofolate synthetase
VKTLNSLRQYLLDKRLSLNKDLSLRARLEDGLIKYLEKIDVANLAIYWPINSEFDPRPIALDWVRNGNQKKLLLPTVKIGQPLLFGEWQDGDKLIKGPQGIPEPIINDQNKFVSPDIILLPCLGWAQHNDQLWRIGYGGGYYDRTLAMLKAANHSVKAVGIAYQDLKVADGAWRPQIHDQALDQLICA